MIQKPTAGKDVLAHNLVIISPVNRRSITRVWVSVEAQYSEFACTKYCRGGEEKKKIAGGKCFWMVHIRYFIFLYIIDSMKHKSDISLPQEQCTNYSPTSSIGRGLIRI